MQYIYSFTTNCTLEEFEKNEGKKYVYCIHGNYGDGNEDDLNTLVFTVDEYMKKYATDSDLVAFLDYVMRRRHVLFIGYGLNEFEIISKAFHSSDEINEKHYILEGFFKYQQELANAQSEYYKSQGVKLIAYCKDEKGYEQQKEILEQWVDQLYRETPYASRSVLSITNALNEFSDNNKSIVSNGLSRDDDLGKINLKAVLETIPISKDRFSWLDFLIDEKYVSVDNIPATINTESGYITQYDDYFESLLRCFDYETDPGDIIQKNKTFIEKCLTNVVEKSEIMKNYGVLAQLVQLTIKLGIADKPGAYEVWKSFYELSHDVGVNLINENIKSIIKWSHELQTKLLSLMFAVPTDNDDTSRQYWLDKAAKTVAKHAKVDARTAIAKFCFDQVNSLDDKLAFCNCLDDRFQFKSEKYERGAFNALQILINSVSTDRKIKICKYMISSATLSFGLQTALHFAAENNYTDVKTFTGNPLRIPSSFVEFYLWLCEVADKLTEDDLDIILKWIEEADFGYERSDDVNRQALITKRINTYKYQLCGIVAMVNTKYLAVMSKYEGVADINLKTPKEDKKAHYAVQMSSSTQITTEKDYFKERYSGSLKAPELLKLVEEAVESSEWGKNDYIYFDIYEELIDTVNVMQFFSIHFLHLSTRLYFICYQLITLFFQVYLIYFLLPPLKRLYIYNNFRRDIYTSFAY